MNDVRIFDDLIWEDRQKKKKLKEIMKQAYEEGRKPFLALLGDRFPYSYFPFNRRSENRAQVTSRASPGKLIMPIVVFAH